MLGRHVQACSHTQASGLTEATALRKQKTAADENMSNETLSGLVRYLCTRKKSVARSALIRLTAMSTRCSEHRENLISFSVLKRSSQGERVRFLVVVGADSSELRGRSRRVRCRIQARVTKNHSFHHCPSSCRQV